MLFILLSIVIVYLLYPNELFLYSDTILGKLMAVIIIIYCTYQNVIYGLFICILIIWFYQSDTLNNFHYRYNEYFSPLAPHIVYSKKNSNCNDNTESKPPLSTFDRLVDVYPDEIPPMKTEAEKIFREQHCSEDLEILYKNNKIIHKEEIAPLFPEISFLDEIPCNPCDSVCKFRLTKIDNETILLPKQARGNDDSIWDWATSWFISKNEPYEGVGSVVSYLS